MTGQRGKDSKLEGELLEVGDNDLGNEDDVEGEVEDGKCLLIYLPILPNYLYFHI